MDGKTLDECITYRCTKRYTCMYADSESNGHRGMWAHIVSHACTQSY